MTTEGLCPYYYMAKEIDRAIKEGQMEMKQPKFEDKDGEISSIE